MFIDASAIVAVLTEEDDGPALVDRLENAPAISTSGLAMFEATLAIARKRNISPQTALEEVETFLQVWEIETVPVGPAEARIAIDAHTRYGKGRHPAKLNMGDCFAYACAKLSGSELLYKGEDFDRTALGAR